MKTVAVAETRDYDPLFADFFSLDGEDSQAWDYVQGTGDLTRTTAAGSKRGGAAAVELGESAMRS